MDSELLRAAFKSHQYSHSISFWLGRPTKVTNLSQEMADQKYQSVIYVVCL